MDFLSLFITLTYILIAQATTPTTFPNLDCLLAAEKTRLQTETKLDNRIKIYDMASARCENALKGSLQNQDLQAVPAELDSWMKLLEASLKDIEGSAARKDRSHALIRYEIHLRKSISNVQELKLKASADQIDSFETWLTRAEEIHKRFVDMLFQR